MGKFEASYSAIKCLCNAPMSPFVSTIISKSFRSSSSTTVAFKRYLLQLFSLSPLSQHHNQPPCISPLTSWQSSSPSPFQHSPRTPSTPAPSQAARFPASPRRPRVLAPQSKQPKLQDHSPSASPTHSESNRHSLNPLTCNTR